MVMSEPSPRRSLSSLTASGLLVALIVPFNMVGETPPSPNAGSKDDPGASGSGWKAHALVRGKPTRVRKVRSITCPEGEVCIGDVYRVRLAGVETLRGEPLPARVTFELTATSKDVLAERIVVLVRTSSGTPEVLSWTHPVQFACFPSDLVDGTEVGKSFYLKDAKTRYSGRPEARRVCTNAAWY